MSRKLITAGLVAMALWATPVISHGAETLAQIKAAVDDLKLTGDAKTKADEVLAKAKADAAGMARDEIIKLLDDDQRLLFDSKMKGLAQAGGEAPGAAGPGGRRPGAGGAGGPGMRPMQIGLRVKEAVAGLGLSAEQTKKVDGVVANVQEKADALRGAGRPGPELRQKVMELRDSAISQMKAILTEEQFGKFQLAMRQPGPGGAGAGPAAGRLGGALQRFQEAMKDLKLTDEQKTKVESVMAEARKKIAEIAPQLQGGQPGPEVREKMRGVFEEVRSGLMEVLTPQQQEKLKEAMQQGGGLGAGRPPGAAVGGGGAPGGDKPAEKKGDYPRTPKAAE